MRFTFLPVAFIIIILLSSCKPYRKGFIVQGNNNDAVQNAISAFLKHDPARIKYDVFYVFIKNISNDIVGISIFPKQTKLVPGESVKVGQLHNKFPSRYFESNGKLFYWVDSTFKISEQLISTLVKYNQIDSMNVNGFVGMPSLGSAPDKTIRGSDYYFCKNNLTKYKKVRSKVAIGWYTPPKLQCN